MNRKIGFTKTYHENLFKGDDSISGMGSNLRNTQVLRQRLVEFFKQYNIKTLIDAPCGDVWWMKEILKLQFFTQYIGIDIVDELITKNIARYATDHVQFYCLDIVDSFPTQNADVLLCRDCLVHLSYESAFKVLEHFSKSNIDYILLTTFTNRERQNNNFSDVFNWYPMNLQKYPFNLPMPEYVINEECPECNGEYRDKSLALWSRREIASHVSVWRNQCGI